MCEDSKDFLSVEPPPSVAPPKCRNPHHTQGGGERKKVGMWLFGWWRTNVSLQQQTARLSPRQGEESRHQRAPSGWLTGPMTCWGVLRLFRQRAEPLKETSPLWAQLNRHYSWLPGAGSHYPRSRIAAAGAGGEHFTEVQLSCKEWLQ